MTSKKQQLLTQALALRDLFKEDDHWAQGYFAFSEPVKDGLLAQKDHASFERIMCSANDEHAKCWCLAGGIQKIIGSDQFGTSLETLVERAIAVHYPEFPGSYSSYVTWNDAEGRTIADVQQVCQTAVELTS